MRSAEYEHTAASAPGFTPPGALVFEYDDGNGLWISSGETPFDQEFLRCASPQDYPVRQALTSGAGRGRGMPNRIETTPVLDALVSKNRRYAALLRNIR